MPRSDLRPNTAEYETLPLVKATGFREGLDGRCQSLTKARLFGPRKLCVALITRLRHEELLRPVGGRPGCFH